MSNCLNPRIAVQNKEGAQPHFIHDIDYDYWSKIYGIDNGYPRILLIPCGKCPSCLQRKSLEWTARLMKEAEEWKYTYFVTLTYDDKHLKDLNKRDLQLFLKRFRKASELECKYYICGEYGEITKRPHYHAILYLNEKLDLVLYGNNLYICKLLDDTWQLGQVLVSSDVNERSIKYTIGYTLKKLGESKITIMSKGLGLKYLNSRKEDIKFSNGFYLNNGFFIDTPFYLKRKIKESVDPSDIAWLKEIENQPKSSVKLDKTIKELISEMLNSKQNHKGKGVF